MSDARGPGGDPFLSRGAGATGRSLSCAAPRIDHRGSNRWPEHHRRRAIERSGYRAVRFRAGARRRRRAGRRARTEDGARVARCPWRDGAPRRRRRAPARPRAGPRRVRLDERRHDPKAAAPTVFKHVVGDAGWQESWVEGLEVYLNPNALIPFDETLIPRGATPAATRRELDRARCFAPSPPDQVENLP